jgi:peptidoglycan/LPS O-acetylase OafA/YrhL
MLRAVAVLLVLGIHALGYPLALPFPQETWAPLAFLKERWLTGGWAGVDLFFVLSGFLISGLLFNEQIRHGRISYGRFFIRRGFKIYPAFYIMVLTRVLIYPFKWPAVLCELFFIQNYGFAHGNALWNHTWSLAVEEHFYLGLPPLLILLARINRGAANPFRAIPVIAIALSVALLILRIVTWNTLPFALGTHLFPTHLRIDGLFFGVFLSYFYHFHFDALAAWVRANRLWLTLAGFVMVLPPFFTNIENVWLYTIGLTALYVGFGALLLVALICSKDQYETKNPWIRFWAFVGSHSYSIYLWHMPVLFWGMGKLMPQTWRTHYWIDFAVAMTLCIAWGIVASVVIEFPMLRLRDRLFPSKASALETR